MKGNLFIYFKKIIVGTYACTYYFCLSGVEKNTFRKLLLSHFKTIETDTVHPNETYTVRQSSINSGRQNKKKTLLGSSTNCSCNCWDRNLSYV